MDNIRLVKELYAVFKAKDYGAFRGLVSEDLVWIQNEGFPGGGTHRGAEAVIEKVFKSFSNEWDGWSYVIEEYLDAGTSVVVFGAYQGVHKKTGKAMRSAAAHIYDIREGKITRFRQYCDTFMIHAARS